MMLAYRATTIVIPQLDIRAGYAQVNRMTESPQSFLPWSVAVRRTFPSFAGIAASPFTIEFGYGMKSDWLSDDVDRGPYGWLAFDWSGETGFGENRR